MFLRRQTGKLVFIVSVCWCAMTLLVFLHIDDRVDIGYHRNRKNAHDDFNNLEMDTALEDSDVKQLKIVEDPYKNTGEGVDNDKDERKDTTLDEGGEPQEENVLQRPNVEAAGDEYEYEDEGQENELDTLWKILPDIPNLPHAVYKPMPLDAPGEGGTPVKLDTGNMSVEEKAKYDEGMKLHVFNQYASDMISVHRSLPDARLPVCKHDYRTDLPSVSVIICFHNEAWSALLRTVHSVLNRTPRHLAEIILVDDFSTMSHLQEPLKAYMGELKKVRLIRTKQREGLVRARMVGVSIAREKVLVFLDSHIECYEGWLEPLIDRVATNSSIIVAPIIDMISAAQFNVWSSPSVNHVGILELHKLEFNWKALSDEQRKKTQTTGEPVRTPTIAGGLFAVNKDFFFHIGSYDEGMDIWGSENLEMSLRVWMCGGSLEIHPCSHVAHVFRHHSPYSFTEKGANAIVMKNIIRLAEVWLDDYKSFYYEHIGYRLVEYGDISERKALRQRLHCKSFDWYIQNVYPDISIPERAIFVGEIRSRANVRPLCIDSMGYQGDGHRVAAGGCHGLGGNQIWRLTETGKLTSSTSCVSYNSQDRKLVFSHCNGADYAPQKWTKREDGRIEHQSTGLCVERDLSTSSIYLTLSPCSDMDTQKWIWKNNRP